MTALEFNLDLLKEKASALKDLFSEKDKKEDQTIDFSNTDEEDDKSTEESVKIASDIALGKTDDQKTVDEETSVITKKDDTTKKQSEQDLEKKLSNIEKVLDKFSGDVTVSKATPLPEDTASVLNLKPLDMGSLIAKDYLSNVTSKMTGQTSSDQDRIALLYDNLRKLNVIK